MRDRLPTPRSALGLFLLTLVLFVTVGPILFALSMELGLLIVEPIAVLLPTLLVIRLLNLNLHGTLRLAPPSLTDLVMAIPLAFALIVINDQLTNLTSQIFPLDEESQKRMIELLRTSGARDWTVKILGIGIGAAVSEEILFRGFIQRGLERGFGRTTAIVTTALLFAAMHMIPHGIPGYFLAGIVLGIVVLASGSIWPPIIVHLLFNVSALALLNLGGIETLGRPVWIPAGILLPSLLIFGMTLSYFIKKMPTPDEEPPPLSHFDTPPPDSFSAIPPGRRRLGWLTVGCAVVLGTMVILGLFGFSIYWTNSRQTNAQRIEEMRQRVTASISASEARKLRVDERFNDLSAVNKRGRLGLLGMGRIYGTYLQATADGTLTLEEIERLLDEIDTVVKTSLPARRL